MKIVSEYDSIESFLLETFKKAKKIMEEIHILHTNDLHSHFENWPRIRRFLQQRRAELIQENKSVIVMDLGDFTDRVHPLTEATNGVANVELMNQIQYDAVTIGNNEGVGNSKDQLNSLYDTANFDVLLCNLQDKETGQAPDWAQPYKIIQTKLGTTIGLIGMTAPFPLTYNPNGWDISFTDEVLPEIVDTLKKQVDSIVLLSHMGIEEEKRIASNYPDIDIILGSHTHHLLPNGLQVNQSMLAAAGRFGEYVGEVSFQIENKKISKMIAKVIEVKQLPKNAMDEMEIIGYMQQGESLLKTNQVAKIPFPMLIEETSEHSMCTYTLAALKEYAKTDVAILNNGLFLQDIPAGIVNKFQLHQALPHPMHIIRVTLSGNDLIRLIREMEKNRFFLRKFHIVGMGFRGKIFGDLKYDGIDYDRRTNTVLWLGEKVEAEKEYKLATVDHFMFIPFFPTIEIAGKVEMLYPDFLRNVLGRYLAEHYPCE